MEVSIKPLGASFYSEQVPVGTVLVRQAMKDLANEFFDAGYKACAIGGIRLTGARRGPMSAGPGAPIYFEVLKSKNPPATIANPGCEGALSSVAGKF